VAAVVRHKEKDGILIKTPNLDETRSCSGVPIA